MPMPIPVSKKVQMEERREQVAEMMLGGFTSRAIAKKLGVSHVTVLEDSKVIRKRLVEAQIETMDAQIGIALARYQRLLEKLEPKILENHAGAIQTAASIQTQIVKLLGLEHAQKIIHQGDPNQPVKVDLSGLSVDELKNLRALMEKTT